MIEMAEGKMKKTFTIIMIIFGLMVLGCVAPFGPVQQPQPDTSTSSGDSDSEEKEKLKEKIADLEKEKLEEKIEELEKRVDEQKQQTPAKTTTQSKTTSAKPPKGFLRVNTPGDGYLALRTLPSSERGQRILKIPHGTFVSIYNCRAVSYVGSRRGRWCQTVYEDNQGWVFSGYLTRSAK